MFGGGSQAGGLLTNFQAAAGSAAAATLKPTTTSAAATPGGPPQSFTAPSPSLVTGRAPARTIASSVSTPDFSPTATGKKSLLGQ